MVGGLVLALASPVWGTPILRQMSFFRLRAIEVRGARYLPPAEVVRRLGVDTSWSLWGDLGALEHRLISHPLVRSVHVERRLPGTLVVTVTENLPVALVPARDGLRAVDVRGRILPIDPSRADVNAPVLPAADRGLLRLLDDLRQHLPALYGQVSSARRLPTGDLQLVLPSLVVRATSDVSSERIADILDVQRDLARRNAHATELDLRFRDQVIARLQ